jgi:hypothetical protein
MAKKKYGKKKKKFGCACGNICKCLKKKSFKKKYHKKKGRKKGGKRKKGPKKGRKKTHNFGRGILNDISMGATGRGLHLIPRERFFPT